MIMTRNMYEYDRHPAEHRVYPQSKFNLLVHECVLLVYYSNDATTNMSGTSQGSFAAFE